MRDSLSKLGDELQFDAEVPSGWLARVDSSQWLGHIQLVLENVCRLVDVLHNRGASVVVHCR